MEILNAIRQGDLVAVKQMLADQPALVNGKDERGFTPLIMATYTSNTPIVSALLAAGAAIDEKGAAGNTALMGVCFKGDEAIVDRKSVV